MPRGVITHAVRDPSHWTSKHSGARGRVRVVGHPVVDHFNSDDTNHVAVNVDVHDLAAMREGDHLARDRGGEASSRGDRPAVDLHREQLIRGPRWQGHRGSVQWGVSG